ncbi:MAG: hypothetical protein RLZZ444_3394 [Pseudomonadota bacterium]
MPKSMLSGVLLTVFSYFLFTLQDASVKWLVETLPVVQILFIRSVVIFLLSLVVGKPKLLADMAASPVLKPMFLRNILLLSAWLSFYSASRSLGLAELTTIYYASPILVTLMAAPLLGEKVPPIRWLAVATGFAGVLVAADPFDKGMTLSMPVNLALLAAVFWAASTVLMRRTAMKERSLVQMAISSGFFIVFTGLAMPWFWTPTSFGNIAIMAGTGIYAGLAQFLMFEGMRRAPVSILAPFEYSSLVWAFVLGYLIWGDIPEQSVFVGAGLIMSAGAIILIGERRTLTMVDERQKPSA